jgi:hypothetical protein
MSTETSSRDNNGDSADYSLSLNDIVGLHEGSLYPDLVAKIWNDLFADVKITDPKMKAEVKNKVLAYFIRNAYSARGEFKKEIRLSNGKILPAQNVQKILGADVRRFLQDPDNVSIQFKLMQHNKELRCIQGRAWDCIDERLWPYCFEGSLSLDELRGEDRAFISAIRATAINRAAAYVRTNTAAKVNNNQASGHAAAAAADSGAYRPPASHGGYTDYD